MINRYPENQLRRHLSLLAAGMAQALMVVMPMHWRS
jgi:hypothetical protein